MTARRDDLAGLDDFIAEHALARRALLRHLADGILCGRQITHLRRPSGLDAFDYPAVNTCTCIRAAGHNHGCWCEHDIATDPRGDQQQPGDVCLPRRVGDGQPELRQRSA
jgi:hypothetical protein